MIAGDDVHHLSHNATTYDGRIVVALVPSSSRAQIESNEIHLPTPTFCRSELLPIR